MSENKFKILFFGDITGRPGRIAVQNYLSALSHIDKPDFVIANVENASHGFGLTKKNYDELLSCGIDCFTAGNHIWDKKEIFDYINEDKVLVRPLNYPENTLGSGCRVFERKGKNIAVLNALGQVFMPPVNSPWEILTEKINEIKSWVDYIIVDFHAEATAEKIALGKYLSEHGVTLFAGTHTHVQTADETIINGMGYITDVGFCGSVSGVIGMDYETSIKRFLAAYPVRYEVAPEDLMRINAIEAVFNDSETVAIKRINVCYNKTDDSVCSVAESGGVYES